MFSIRATHSVAAKKYEKDRRIRFNALLDRLAAVLPGCPVGNPDNKWTKAQVYKLKYPANNSSAMYLN